LGKRVEIGLCISFLKETDLFMKCLFLAVTVLMFSGLAFNPKAQPMISGKQSQALSDSSQLIANEIVKSEIPVLVDFWAPWCGPCRLLNPIIQELEKEFAGKVRFVKVNVDVHRSIAAYFEVRSIPVVFIINKKVAVKAIPGLQPKEAYVEALKEVLALPSPAEPASPKKTDK